MFIFFNFPESSLISLIKENKWLHHHPKAKSVPWTYHEGKVPWLRHTEITGPECLNVPRHDTEEKGVQHQHAKNMCQGEGIIWRHSREEQPPLYPWACAFKHGGQLAAKAHGSVAKKAQGQLVTESEAGIAWPQHSVWHIGEEPYKSCDGCCTVCCVWGINNRIQQHVLWLYYVGCQEFSLCNDTPCCDLSGYENNHSWKEVRKMLRNEENIKQCEAIKWSNTPDILC